MALRRISLKSPIAILFAVVAFFIGLAGVLTLVGNSTDGASVGERMPYAFLIARTNAAQASQKIVEFTGAANDQIRTANELEAKGDSAAAATHFADARRNNALAKTAAKELSSYLTQMSTLLVQIESARSRKLAYDAITTEISLVGELLNYAKSLDGFLDTVQGNGKNSEPAIQERLDAVNQQASLVNTLNKTFLDEIGAFDQSLLGE